MRRRPFLIVTMAAGFCLLIMAACALFLAGILRALPAADASHYINVGTLKRHYLLHVPPNLPADKPAPLLLVFHGGGGRAWTMPGFTRFDDLADQSGFIVAYPDGVDRSWNDGRGRSTVDDVAFIRALIGELESSNRIDPNRIYATGISNGGFFSNRLACDLTDKIAAIASVAATMPEDLVSICHPSRPISVMYIHGTDDPLVPIGGGDIKILRQDRGRVISLDAATKFWLANDRISSPPVTPVVTNLPDQVDDGTHVHREIWTGGKDGTEVIVYTIQGGGHTWPDGPQYLPKFMVGKASGNLDATRTIWEFFKSQRLP